MKMTVHEALCSVKISDKRIMLALQDAVFIGKKKVSETKVSGKEIGDFEKGVISDYDSITAIIKRTESIKAALSLSNAKTMIEVAGRKMSIAEAIYEINYGIPVKKNLLRVFTEQYKNVIKQVEDMNGAKLDAAAEKYITSNFGAKEKVDGKILREAEDEYRKRNTVEIIDPLNLKEKIDALQKEINTFETSVDSAIQVSNATTIIEIPD